MSSDMQLPGPLIGRLEQSTADTWVTRKGNTVSTGKETTRLFLDCLKEGGTRVAIAVLDTAKISKMDRNKFVPLQIQTPDGQAKTVWVSAKELGQRLHIAQDDVKELAKVPGRLEKQIQKDAKSLSDKLAKYNDIFGNYIEKRVFLRKQMVTTTGSKTGLTRGTLNKVVFQALSLGLGKNESATFSVGGTFGFGTVRMMAVTDEAGRLKELKRSVKLIGAGSFGRVQKVVDLCAPQGGSSVLKTALSGGSARQQLINEKDKLAYLNRNGPKKGIPPATTAFHVAANVDEKGVSRGQIVVFETKEFLCDILKFFKNGMSVSGTVSKEIQTERRMQAFDQLLSGLAQLEEDHIVHGDIKPENVLVNVADDGTCEFVLADYGGSRILRDDPDHETGDKLEVGKKNETSRTTGTHTPGYLVSRDVQSLKRTAQTAFQATSEKEKSAAVRKHEQYQHKRDVYALGALLIEMMVGKPAPNETDEDHAKHLRLYANTIEDKKIGKLLLQMIDPDIEKRPLPSEALQRFQDIQAKAKR